MRSFALNSDWRPRDYLKMRSNDAHMLVSAPFGSTWTKTGRYMLMRSSRARKKLLMLMRDRLHKPSF